MLVCSFILCSAEEESLVLQAGSSLLSRGLVEEGRGVQRTAGSEREGKVEQMVR